MDPGDMAECGALKRKRVGSTGRECGERRIHSLVFLFPLESVLGEVPFPEVGGHGQGG